MKILIVQNFRKVVTSNDSSRLSKGCFSLTTALIFFMRVTISNATIKKRFDWSCSQLVFCIKIRPLPNWKIFLDVCRYSISFFFYNYTINFFEQGLNGKLESFAVVFEKNLYHFDPCLSVLIAQTIQLCQQFCFNYKFNLKILCNYRLNFSVMVSIKITKLDQSIVFNFLIIQPYSRISILIIYMFQLC